MDVKNLPLADLKPYDNNPRKNDSAVDAVAKSIEQFGFKVPIVIDADKVIVCGHTRYKAAQQLGLDCVPCVIADDLSPEKIKAFRLADNKTAELAVWDFEQLRFELDDLKNIAVDMNDFGFDVASFKNIDDFFEEVEPRGNSMKPSQDRPTEPITKKVVATEPDEHDAESSNNKINPNKIICPHCGKTFEL